MTDMGFGGGMGAGLGSAQCALHSDQPAMRTCTRCGSFMCSFCAEGGAQSLCPTCQQRLGLGQLFPLTRDNWSFSALWDYCFEIFKREWLMLSAAMLVYFGIVFVVQLVSSVLPAIGTAAKSQGLFLILTSVSTVLQQAVQGVMGLGLMRMMFGLLQGQKLDIGQLFSQFHKVGTLLLTVLLVFLIVIVPVGILGAIGGTIAYIQGSSGMQWSSLGLFAVVVGVLGLVPLIYFLIPLFLMQPELAYKDDVTATQVIRNCYAYARGQRLSIFGVGLVGMLVTLVGLLACCVGMLPAMGLTYLLFAGLYLALRNGAEVED
jgi:hypothetical protein